MTVNFNLKTRIQEDMQSSLRARDTQKLGVVRLIWAAIKQKEIDSRIVAEDDTIIKILQKMIKQRDESIQHYNKAKREDLIKQEKFEISIIQSYLPAPPSMEEIEKVMQEVIASFTNPSMRDMSAIISKIKEKLPYAADMALLSQKIKEKLSRI